MSAVEPANVNIKPGKLSVYERDVALAVLYGTPSIILLQHQAGTNRTGTAFVYVYTVHKYAIHIILNQLKTDLVFIVRYSVHFSTLISK